MKICIILGCGKYAHAKGHCASHYAKIPEIRARNYLNRKNNDRKNGNAITHKYEKTKNGFLMRVYRNMRSRIAGVQKEKFHLYAGKNIELNSRKSNNWTANYCINGPPLGGKKI